MSGVDPITVALVLSGLGVLLTLAELLVPGGFALVLGIGALVTGGLSAAGLFDTLVGAALTWALLTVVGFFGVMRVLSRKFGGGPKREDLDEDKNAYDQVVEVVQRVEAGSTDGRIHYRGSSWPATSTEGAIPEGSRVRIVARDGMAWVVEPVRPEDEELGHRIDALDGEPDPPREGS